MKDREAAVRIVNAALNEEQERFGPEMDGLSPGDLKDFYSRIDEIHRALRSVMKRRGVSIPVLFTFSRDQDQGD